MLTDFLLTVAFLLTARRYRLDTPHKDNIRADFLNVAPKNTYGRAFAKRKQLYLRGHYKRHNTPAVEVYFNVRHVTEPTAVHYIHNLFILKLRQTAYTQSAHLRHSGCESERFYVICCLSFPDKGRARQVCPRQPSPTLCRAFRSLHTDQWRCLREA